MSHSSYAVASPEVPSSALPLTHLSVYFFMWGVLTSVNGVLVLYFQQLFNIDYQQSMLVQFAFYLAPFVVCLPISLFMGRRGYKRALVLAAGLAVAGCLLMGVALAQLSFVMTLGAVFIAALGVAALQVVASPYATHLGDAHTATSRMALLSGINSFGTTVAPLLIAGVLGSAVFGLGSVYVGVAIALIALLATMRYCQLPDLRSEQPLKLAEQSRQLLAKKSFIVAVLTIAVYVGVEVSVGTTAISYLVAPELGGFDMRRATSLIALYWCGAMVGRVGFGLFGRRFDPMKALAFAACIAMALLLLAMSFGNSWGGVCLLAIGLFNSAMHPVIFTRAIRGLGDLSGMAASILVMANLGGALLSLGQAFLVDLVGLRFSFVLPLLGYAWLFGYSRYARRAD